MSWNKNIKFFLNYWLGPLIFLWLSWSIYRQVKLQPNLGSTWWQIKTALTGDQAWKLLTVIGLMGLNWGLEAQKWKELVRPIYRISFVNALKATLAGVAFAINTPNRIGEYGGRMLYIPEGRRLESISLTLIGSFSQLLTTIFAGAIALWVWYARQIRLALPESWNLEDVWLLALAWIISGIAVLMLLLYLRISWLVRLVEKIRGIEKWLYVLNVIDHLPVTILLRVLGWSAIRYIVFVIQYILLLQCFEVTDAVWTTSWLVSMQFVIMAVIPTIALADIGIRGKLALELFGMISANQLGIIAAALGIWLINLVVPAVLGSLLIIRIKLVTGEAVKEPER